MIEINNLTRSQIDEKFLKKVAKIVLEDEFAIWRNKNLDLSIAFVSRARIKKINKKYRKKDKVTDVLSFSGVNEIIICPQEARKEIAKVLIHGILHLSGYNHREMKGKEKYYLLKIK